MRSEDDEEEVGITDLFSEIKNIQEENCHIWTDEELRLIVLKALKKRDLDMALEAGKELEMKYFAIKNEKMVRATRLLNSFINDLIRWPISVLQESRYKAMNCISDWYERQIHGWIDTYKESRKEIIRWLLSLEEGDTYYFNDPKRQILTEISHNRENVLQLKDHPLFEAVECLKFLRYIPKFTLDEHSNSIEIKKSPFFNFLEPVEKLLIRLHDRNLFMSKPRTIVFNQLPTELQALEGIFIEKSEDGELVRLTEQGKFYSEFIIKFYLKRESYTPFRIELNFLVFNELLRVVARMCFLPPEMVIMSIDLAREDLKELPLESVEYLIFLLIKENVEYETKSSYQVEYYFWIENFIDILQKWQVPLPSFEFIPRNSIKVIDNPWSSQFYYVLQNFLKLKELDIVKAIFSRRRGDGYLPQQGLLYDYRFMRELSSYGWRFLTYFEDLLAGKILQFHFDSLPVVSVTSEINSIFTKSLKDLEFFLQIINKSNKIVQINEYLEVRFIGGATRIYVEGKEFLHCKYILLINPQEHDNQDQIDSIDEAEKRLNRDLDRRDIKPSDLGISPEEEFWAHVSNLQAWVEHGYDTRLLHSNLSFPLLKKLSLIDPVARMRFQEEIVSRISARYFPVIAYLMNQNYHDYLTLEQLEVLEEVLEEIHAEKSIDPVNKKEAKSIGVYIQKVKEHQELLKRDFLNQFHPKW